jgi:hypothetical protein
MRKHIVMHVSDRRRDTPLPFYLYAFAISPTGYILSVTYLKIGNSRKGRHPRESGGPFNVLIKIDSRLRGNDNYEVKQRGKGILR